MNARRSDALGYRLQATGYRQSVHTSHASDPSPAPHAPRPRSGEARSEDSRFTTHDSLAARALRLCTLTLVVLLHLIPPPSHAEDPRAAPIVSSVDSIGITVNDLDRAVAFYTDVLGFRELMRDEVADENHARLYGVFGLRLATATLALGEERIELLQFLAPLGRPAPDDSKSNDAWFQHVAIIVSDMERAYAHLRRHSVAHASTGPQRLPDWNPNAGGISAFYFRDPDGNHLEILQFPTGKGDPKWHRTTDRLFLGIDHTAIVVADTERSLRFYRDALGMSVAGTSENYGIEQERLNNVFGARLRITALRAARGPGVELLEYLAPRTGRPMPVDTHANDDWHWQVNVTASIDAADGVVRGGRYSYVSPGPVKYGASALGLMVRDPDGHALLLRAPPERAAAAGDWQLATSQRPSEARMWFRRSQPIWSTDRTEKQRSQVVRTFSSEDSRSGQ